MEQLCNAVALETLGLGDVMHHMDSVILTGWLEKENPEAIEYPCVAEAIVNWIRSGFAADASELARMLWTTVR